MKWSGPRKKTRGSAANTTVPTEGTQKVARRAFGSLATLPRWMLIEAKPFRILKLHGGHNRSDAIEYRN